jgi:hypothetical protein
MFFLITGCYGKDICYESQINLSESVIMDFQRKNNKRQIPFTLDFPGNYGMPVVRIKICGIYFYFVVDTGGGGNMLTGNGIVKSKVIATKKKMTYEKWLDKNGFDLRENNVYGEFIDGVLGYKFLSKYKTVMFDYKTKYLIFNKRISNKSLIPMEIFHKQLYINFKYNGKAYKSLIDTGSNMFVISNEFLYDNIKEENAEGIYSFDISLADIYYEKITAYSYKYDKWNGEQKPKDLMNRICLVGYPFFKDKIVYFNMEKLLFGIK